MRLLDQGIGRSRFRNGLLQVAAFDQTFSLGLFARLTEAFELIFTFAQFGLDSGVVGRSLVRSLGPIALATAAIEAHPILPVPHHVAEGIALAQGVAKLVGVGTLLRHSVLGLLQVGQGFVKLLHVRHLLGHLLQLVLRCFRLSPAFCMLPSFMAC